MAHLILVTRMRFKSSRDSRAAKGGGHRGERQKPPWDGLECRFQKLCYSCATEVVNSNIFEVP